MILDHGSNGRHITTDYILEKQKIGHGTYGTVLKAVHNNTGAARAVKKIQKNRFKGQGRLEQIRQEIAIMKEMDHPGILKLYETYEDRTNLYLVMELCKGGELFDRLCDQRDGSTRPLSEENSAFYMKQILAAVYYMHSNGKMHRDLKPENFLLLGPSDHDPLKVIDFGLACRFKPGDVQKTRVGTPYYVSPQVLGGPYTEKSDVWSCGVICYIMLCGFPPFYGETDPEIMAMVKRGHFSFPSPEWLAVSSEAKGLIEALLQYHEAKRLSAEEALHHPWIQRTVRWSHEITVTSAQRIVNNFKNFHMQGRLKKVAMTMIAQHLKEEQIEELRGLFETIDLNDDGTLTFIEIKDALSTANPDLARSIEDYLGEIDSDASGVIEYTEFLAAAMERRMYIRRDVCWDAFQVLDINSDGVITKEELQKVLSSDDVQNLHPMDSIEEMIKEVDLNNDGLVDFEEFFQMMNSRTGFLRNSPTSAQRPFGFDEFADERRVTHSQA
jgi:calcium-dependent protein kinase